MRWLPEVLQQLRHFRTVQKSGPLPTKVNLKINLLNKFNTLVRVGLVLFLIVPIPVFADHVPTQPPYNQSIALDTDTGDLTIGIYSSDGFEDSLPEKYTIWFTISDSEIDTTTAYCISTSFGHGSNLAWQYHVFSLEDLQTYFETPNGTFRTKIRADNDTDNSFSTLTTEMTIAIPDQLPFINLGNWSAPTNTCTDTSTTTTTTSTTIPAAAPNAPTNTSVNYQGEDVFFNWEYSPGETDLVEFHINYSYDNQTWTRVVISDVDATSYTLDKSLIQTGTFYWEIASCGDVSAGESCSNGDSNNFETTEYVAPTTTLAPAPQPAPEPEPEPAPPPITEVVVIGGEEVEYTEVQVLDGNIDRDLQRDKNQDLYGCSLTDAQLARGDDCDGEVIVEIITVDEFDEMDNDDWDNDDFIDDEYVLTDEEIEELERQAQKDAERMQRELDELEKEIEKQVIDKLGDDFFDGPVDDLSDEELLELEELVDSIIFLQENVDFDDFVVIDDEPDFLNEIEFDDEIIIVIPEDDKKEDVAPIIEVLLQS